MKMTKEINKLEKELNECLSIKKRFPHEYIKIAKPFFAGLERVKHLHGSEQWKIEAEEILRLHETFTSTIEKSEAFVDTKIERIKSEIESLKQIEK